MNYDDIKKIVSETISNPDVLSFLVKQMQDQIEKEQSKVEPKIDNHTKDKINDIKSKADNYTSNNEYVNKYISERDKYMDVFKKVTEKLNTKNVSIEKEITQEPSKKSWTQNISQASMMHNFSDGWYKWHQQTTNGKVVSNMFFNLISDMKEPNDTFLNFYSIFTLHADEWTNWDMENFDWHIPNYPISKLVDSYVYEFTKEESETIDSNEDNVCSYSYVTVDDELPMLSIYIINYSKNTDKVYDFNRIIFTPSDDASENDVRLFYFDLYKYLSNISAIKNTLEDFCYTYINNYRIHGVEPIISSSEDYCKYIQDVILNLIDAKKKDGIKLTIKKEDTPDKTNSVLDKLGIPHDEKGNVEIPISDDKFISNRMDSMNKASEFLKDWFDLDDEEEMEDVPVEDNEEDIKYTINTENTKFSEFLSKAINDGYIKVEVLSPEHVYLNINGTNVFMINPYGNNL